MSKDTLAALSKIRIQLMKLVVAQSNDKDKNSIRRAAVAITDAILDGRGA